MKKFFSFFLLLSVNACLYSEEINHMNLLEFLNSKQFFSSNFSQLTIQDFKEREVQGKIRANRMGKFKIGYFEPIQEVISADGTFLYKLDLELEQLDVVPQEDVFEGTPISLFTSTIQDLNNLYTVKPCIELEDILMCEILPKSELVIVSFNSLVIKLAVPSAVFRAIFPVNPSATITFLSLIHISEPTRPY